LLSYDNNSNYPSQLLFRWSIHQGTAGNARHDYCTWREWLAAFASYSDSRLNGNIADLPDQYINIRALRPVEFDYIEQ
jgi:hypothetical protein